MRTETLKIRQGKLQLLAPLLLVIGLFAIGTGASYAADTAKGASLYAMHCASCHGASGISISSGTPKITQSGSMLRSDAMLLRAIKDGKNAMPGYMGVLSDRDILDVIAHMRTFN